MGVDWEDLWHEEAVLLALRLLETPNEAGEVCIPQPFSIWLCTRCVGHSYLVTYHHRSGSGACVFGCLILQLRTTDQGPALRCAHFMNHRAETRFS